MVNHTKKRKTKKRKTKKRIMRYKGGAAEQQQQLNNDKIFNDHKTLLTDALSKLNETIVILDVTKATRVARLKRQLLSKIRIDLNSISYDDGPDIVINKIKQIVREILDASGYIPEVETKQFVLQLASQIINSNLAHFHFDVSNKNTAPPSPQQELLLPHNMNRFPVNAHSKKNGPSRESSIWGGYL